MEVYVLHNSARLAGHEDQTERMKTLSLVTHLLLWVCNCFGDFTEQLLMTENILFWIPLFRILYQYKKWIVLNGAALGNELKIQHVHDQ